MNLSALDGIKVVECTQGGLQGSFAGVLLAELGADVIHVEQPQGDPQRRVKFMLGQSIAYADGTSALHNLSNRSKRSLSLDLTRPEAREIIERIVAQCDVFLSSLQPHAIAKLGLGYAALSALNPRLIYGVASGFGPLGPDSDKPVFDYVAQARSGFMHMGGEPGSEPSLFSPGAGDIMGGIMLAYGVLAALVARDRYGIGQEVTASQLGALLMLQGQGVSYFLSNLREPVKASHEKPASPLWNHYQCKDGRWIALGITKTDRQWPSICAIFGIERYENDPRFANQELRRANRDELCAILTETFATRDSNEWLKRLREADFPFSRVNTYHDVLADPQVMLNKFIVEVDHPTMGKKPLLGHPVAMEKTPIEVRGWAPGLGEHTEAVLGEIGYSREEVAALKERGVV